MPRRQLADDLRAHRMADRGDGLLAGIPQERGDEVGHALDREGALGCRGVAEAGQIDREHAAALRERVDELDVGVAPHPEPVDQEVRGAPDPRSLTSTTCSPTWNPSDVFTSQTLPRVSCRRTPQSIERTLWMPMRTASRPSTGLTVPTSVVLRSHA